MMMMREGRERASEEPPPLKVDSASTRLFKIEKAVATQHSLWRFSYTGSVQCSTVPTPSVTTYSKIGRARCNEWIREPPTLPPPPT